MALVALVRVLQAREINRARERNAQLIVAGIPRRRVRTSSRQSGLRSFRGHLTILIFDFFFFFNGKQYNLAAGLGSTRSCIQFCSCGWGGGGVPGLGPGSWSKACCSSSAQGTSFPALHCCHPQCRCGPIRSPDASSFQRRAW